MKKISLLVFVIILSQNFSFSQVDFKGGLYASIPFGFFSAVEYGLYDDLGIELGVISNPGMKRGQTHVSGTAIMLNARYYFSPDYGLDRFYAGFYLRPHTSVIKKEIPNFFFPVFPTPTNATFEFLRDSGVGIGLLIGKKFIKKNNYSIDLNVGFGRNVGRRVYDIEAPSSVFGGGRLDRVDLDFLYSLVIGYRL
jgi:hypothetical protein